MMISVGEGPSSGRPRAAWIEEENQKAKRCHNWIRAHADEMAAKRKTTMSAAEVPSSGGANPKPEMRVLDWILSGFDEGQNSDKEECADEGPSSGKKECANEGAAKWARCLPHICEHKCLATTKRGRGSGEGVEDLISDLGNDHDDDEASFS
jgi:hypothetical protein